MNILDVRNQQAGAARLTLADDLGHDVDGAWWPRSSLVSRELPDLITALGGRLGEIVDIHVNWSSNDPPSLTFYGGLPKRLPIMTIRGSSASTRILVIPHKTAAALAVMVLLHAAYLPTGHTQASLKAFQAADAIVASARTQCASLRGA
jgi:hypothetical protein